MLPTTDKWANHNLGPQPLDRLFWTFIPALGDFQKSKKGLAQMLGCVTKRIGVADKCIFQFPGLSLRDRPPFSVQMLRQGLAGSPATGAGMTLSSGQVFWQLPISSKV